MYAVVSIKGFQYNVEEGAYLKVPTLPQTSGESVTFDKVLCVRRDEDKSATFGAPYVDGAGVKATVVSHGRYPKIRVIKFKRKKNYKRNKGHRQDYTLIKVESIQG